MVWINRRSGRRNRSALNPNKSTGRRWIPPRPLPSCSSSPTEGWQRRTCMRTMTRLLTAFLLAGMTLLAAVPAPAQGPVTVQAAVDRIVQQEARTAKLLRTYSPRFETYIQEERPDAEMGSVPVKDHY